MPKVNISIEVNPSIFLKNPTETSLGKKIIFHSISLFNRLGFEEFNFKKLAKEMDSTEASVYRYFENKYKLLSYLVAWYWDYMHYILLMDSRNVKLPIDKLDIMITSLINSLENSNVPDYIDQSGLHRLVVENATKVYHHKKVDDLKNNGFYMNYKKLVQTLSKVISEVDGSYKYPMALATTIMDMSLNNEYYLIHLPEVTDNKDCKEGDARALTNDMIQYMVKKLLNVTEN